ncbi:MAG: hypothetical protein U0354_12215 [Candidatus Sericytochromatia bacterium]
MKLSKRIPISPDFFCDGDGYVLTSSSLGNSNLTPQKFSDLVLDGSFNDIKPVLEKGVCMPILFEADCVLDRKTLFVLGDLTEKEEKEWIAKLSWKLNIPCGKLILFCSCMTEDVARAISGKEPEENYMIYQTVDVPPDLYKVEIYAYRHSPTYWLTLSDEEYEEFEENEGDLLDGDYDEDGNLITVGYIIRLSPLKENLVLPNLGDTWFKDFEFRK